MHDALEIAGRKLKSTKWIRTNFGISWITLNRWMLVGLIPPPVRLGRRNYYDQQEVENRILLGEP
jgi:predicted site-specific integrase-resolvase